MGFTMQSVITGLYFFPQEIVSVSAWWILEEETDLGKGRGGLICCRSWKTLNGSGSSKKRKAELSERWWVTVLLQLELT